MQQKWVGGGGGGGGVPKLVSLSDRYNQDYSIVETILGSPD